MLQTEHQSAANVVVLRPRPAVTGPVGLSPAVMAGYLRQTDPLNARCFALEMHDQAAWANAAWGAYWSDVADLV